MTDSLLTAFALMLVIEGLMPFLSPTLWRQLFSRLLAMSDGQIRFIGLSSMMAGLLLAVLLSHSHDNGRFGLSHLASCNALLS